MENAKLIARVTKILWKQLGVLKFEFIFQELNFFSKNLIETKITVVDWDFTNI